MKAFMLQRLLGAPIDGATAARVMCDSAIVTRERPVFIPLQVAPEWQAAPCLAARIGRLGKSISAKFAHRYVDAVAPAMAMTRAGESPCPDLDACVDGALALGPWLETHNIDATFHVNVLTENMSTGQSEASADIAIDPQRLLLAQAVSHLSQWATLKTGDIVIAAAIAPPVAIAVNTQVTMTLASDAAADALQFVFRYK